MMVTIKNMHAGVIVIPDADLRLLPGETASHPFETEGIRRFIRNGVIVKTGNSGKDVPSEKNLTEPDIPDLGALNATDAIAKIHDEKDPLTLKSMMEHEKRKSVIDAMKQRLSEIGSEHA